MSLHGAYEADNIFARILRGEIPSARVYEDDAVVALLDAFPQSRGHSLVIHKTSQARNILDVEPQALCDITGVVQKVAAGLTAALDPEGLLVAQFNGAPVGQTIFHLHFHVIPKFPGAHIGLHAAGKQADFAELEQLARHISKAIDASA